MTTSIELGLEEGGKVVVSSHSRSCFSTLNEDDEDDDFLVLLENGGTRRSRCRADRAATMEREPSGGGKSPGARLPRVNERRDDHKLDDNNIVGGITVNKKAGGNHHVVGRGRSTNQKPRDLVPRAAEDEDRKHAGAAEDDDDEPPGLFLEPITSFTSIFSPLPETMLAAYASESAVGWLGRAIECVSPTADELFTDNFLGLFPLGDAVRVREVLDQTSDKAADGRTTSTVDSSRSMSTGENDDSQDDDGANAFYQVPERPTYLMDQHVTGVPCSPWTHRTRQKTLRPMEPLPHAKVTALAALILAFVPTAYLVLETVWAERSFGAVILQVLVSIVMFFGFLWNAFSLASSIVKCFIPSKAFKTNTRYCSVLPEAKDPSKEWPHVTIQATVYKESFPDVIVPTLETCIASRDQYILTTGAYCNVVVCDDSIMSYLDNSFAAARILWGRIQETKKGKVLRLDALLKSLPLDELALIKPIKWNHLYKAFDRMTYYNYKNVGFVARSTLNRRGKFKKAGNMNAHLRLAFGAQQLSDSKGISFEEAADELTMTADGAARLIMYGNDIRIGEVMAINDADSRMPENIMALTVPEFLNDEKLGFTQHCTKTLSHQRSGTSYLNMITGHTDFMYQGHFLTSSILGFHPPLVGHSALLRTEGLRTCGKMRSFRHAQTWLRNIGLGFLPVDQVGNDQLESDFAAEYWSESNCSEDFELMIHLYNLGYDGRYVAYEGAEYEEGVTRTFDEEAERYRRFSVGGHELVYNSFQNMFGHGIFSRDFWSFLKSDMPGYYKIYLTAYLMSYTAGGTFVLLYSCASLARLFEPGEGFVMVLYSLTPASFMILNLVIYTVISNITFVIAMIRMYINNKDLFFPEYRRGLLFMLYKLIAFSIPFQFYFYTVMANFAFLGSMDHLLSNTGPFQTTNKDLIESSRLRALGEIIHFNRGNFLVASFIGGLAVLVFCDSWKGTDDLNTEVLLFTTPAFYLSFMAFFVPFYLNPYIWPCAIGRRRRASKSKTKSSRAYKSSSDTSRINQLSPADGGSAKGKNRAS